MTLGPQDAEPMEPLRLALLRLVSDELATEHLPGLAADALARVWTLPRFASLLEPRAPRCEMRAICSSRSSTNWVDRAERGGRAAGSRKVLGGRDAGGTLPAVLGSEPHMVEGGEPSGQAR